MGKRKERASSRLRRTKSREMILLSVLNIETDIDAEQLEQCAESAMSKYNEDKQAAALERSQSLSRSLSQSLILESCLESNHQMENADKSIFHNDLKDDEDQQSVHSNTSTLADPYDEDQWNGLDPDDYFWDDDMAEGDCYDDDEFSLRDRRTQYLVVMAVDNRYCSISDLTYEQNELLLQHQDS